MIAVTKRLTLVRVGVPCLAAVLVAACGGGSSGNTGGPTSNPTTYDVSAAAGTGGTISPSSATVDAGGTTKLTVTPSSGYAISGVTGCGGSLSGNTYTTGAISANCTVTASFSAALTWVGGSSTANPTGVYGTQGVAADTNVPGGRSGAARWTDANGNLWLFGGSGYDSAGNADLLNDLWEYSPSIGEWTWVSGSNTAPAKGVYGTRGVAATTNVPGARYGAVGWKDAHGNLWLFGGSGQDSTGTNGDLNDLWEYPTQ